MQVNYARNPGHAKLRLLSRRPDFPAARWGDVISNALIDLNDVFDLMSRSKIR